MNSAPGPGVDAQGRAVVDPTQNVLDLVRAESRRQDDLRHAERRLHKAEERHARDLRKAEAKRVDALRAGDQAAIKAAAEKVDATAATLAATVAAAAEAMRAAQAAQAEAFTKALAEVQRFQYGQQGGTAQVSETRARADSLGVWVAIAATLLLGALSLLVNLVR